MLGLNTNSIKKLDILQESISLARANKAGLLVFKVSETLSAQEVDMAH